MELIINLPEIGKTASLIKDYICKIIVAKSPDFLTTKFGKEIFSLFNRKDLRLCKMNISILKKR